MGINLTAEETTTTDCIVYTDAGTPITVGLIAPRYEMQRYGKTRQFVPVYDDRLIHYLSQSFRELVWNMFDCPVLITGPRRIGKSTITQAIATDIDPRLTVDNICFRLEEFNDRMRELPAANPKEGKFPQIIQDESGYDLFAQDWADRMQKNMVKQMEIIGKKRIISYWVLPHRKLLNRGIRESVIKFWINVATIDQKRGLAELRQAQDNIWDLDKYWKPICAFTFKELDNDLWKQYEIKKDLFINEAQAEANEIKGKPRKFLDQRDLLIKDSSRTEEYLADLLQMSQPRISQIKRSRPPL